MDQVIDAAPVKHTAPEVLPARPPGDKGGGALWLTNGVADGRPLQPRSFGPLPRPPVGFYDPISVPTDVSRGPSETSITHKSERFHSMCDANVI